MHHLDFNRSNNNPNNLLILEEGQHNLLHSWLEKGAPIGQLKVSLKKEVKLIVKGIVKISDAKRCQECKEIFSAYGKFCSSRCSQKSQRTNIPKKELKLLLKNGTPWTKIGKLYGISDNGARKIAKRLGIDIEKYKKKRT